MVKAYVLSEQDVAILRDLIARERARYLNKSTQVPSELINPPGLSPDTHIVKPVGEVDIPALSDTTPGIGECNVYGLINSVLVDFGFTIWVYNTSTTAITGTEYFTAIRTKFGDWVPASVGGESSAPIVHFSIDEFDEESGLATCSLTAIPCDGVVPGLQEDGTVIVRDIEGCYFDEPREELIGRKGHAHWMRVTSSGSITGTGTGTGTSEEECEWVCGGLCCPPVEPLAE